MVVEWWLSDKGAILVIIYASAYPRLFMMAEKSVAKATTASERDSSAGAECTEHTFLL